MLKGQAKKDYQREYMRKRRQNVRPVRPMLDLEPVRPVKTQQDIIRDLQAKIDKIKPQDNKEEPIMDSVARGVPTPEKTKDQIEVEKKARWLGFGKG